ncbi:MAG: hypothetical protein JWR42_797 [Marmoricola sp.]|nr:hypothetical protein [Marmoricola sp.]
MPPVLVVGAGIAGAACARRLRAAGIEVELLDRGRRVGGRMASRTLAGRPVDTGASYFTVSDDGFAAVVEDWEGRGLARRWTDTFHVLSPSQGPLDAPGKQGPVRWGAGRGLRSLVEDLLTDLPVRRHEVDRVVLDATGRLLVDGQPAGAVVLAMPDAQARRLLDQGAGDAPGTTLDAVAERLDRPSDPALALSAVFAERTWDPADGHLDGAFVNDDDVLSWVADDGRRRGDDAPVLVAHSTPAFAAAHLEDPQAALPELLAALTRLLDLRQRPVETHVQRWSLAKASGERPAPFLLQDVGGTPLGVCGDGWGPVSKVEGAWLSGDRLGAALAEVLGSGPHPSAAGTTREG